MFTASPRNPFHLRRALLLLSLASLLLLAACGSSTDKDGNATEENNGTRLFSTINGDIEIPTHPKRIVTQGFLPYFIQFGVKPVGAPSWEIEYPHLAGKTDGIVDIGVIDAGAVESILSLKPDLIVTVAQEMYEQLSKIAPTIVIPYDAVGDVYADTRLFGSLLGKEEEAEQWLVEFDKKVAESRDKLQAAVKDGETFSLIGAFDKTYYIYGDGIYRGGQAMYKHLGLQPPAIIQQQLMDADKDLIEVSLEVIPDYAGDHIFLDVSNGSKFDESEAVWQSIDAVKNGRVYRLNTDIFWPYDPMAVYMQLDEVLKLIAPGSSEG